MIDFIDWSHPSNSTWFMHVSLLLPPFLKNYLTLNHVNPKRTKKNPETCLTLTTPDNGRALRPS